MTPQQQQQACEDWAKKAMQELRALGVFYFVALQPPGQTGKEAAKLIVSNLPKDKVGELIQELGKHIGKEMLERN